MALLGRLTRPGGTVLVSMPNLLGLGRIYQRLAHQVRDGASFYRHIRHFSSPALLRLHRHGLTLTEAHHFDHHTRMADLTHRLGLPAPLTEELLVAVCRKD
jgi:hypothetical protein